MIRWFIEVNRKASRAFDGLLPTKFSIDGNRDFLEHIAPAYLRHGLNVVDVGGGRHPFIGTAAKSSFQARVTGLDIDGAELAAAPAGAYDDTIVADIAHYRGKADADVVICQAVLEHVADTQAAFASLKSMVRPGGRILLFVPCRNAAFARANLLIPQRVKRRLLFYIYPEARGGQGFPSYYNRCTPSDFRRLATDLGLVIEAEKFYWSSAYFTFFAPLHILWRLAQLLAVAILRRQAAESFSMVVVKPRRTQQVS
jgi:SAM-dependent methyltransferase